MCGRYEMFISPENREMMRIVEDIENKYGAKNNMRTGEIFPTNVVPILSCDSSNIMPELSIWGFPKFHSKGVIINSRAETAIDKPTFRKNLLERRCVIPSTGFYEWKQDVSKKKYKFNLADSENLYMAGIWNEFKNEKRFVILTTAANNSMVDIHNRMPIVLQKEKIEDWIIDTDYAMMLLNEEQPVLERIEV
ncbi:SOS response-associated peptidase [Anaerotignum propionicum]|uniref:Abasic site processing protein n=1 Tax=Anaerotignum propionicum DSM 1682 TaxID=991789 RepID=A0A0X1U7V5_ANAPI|nr:SOS response-associated peptidase [Anaerotignum propionicum]AMJ41019.1 putative SOS response-associated peptidase YedK [Anaerotignum propionicum DSM 1682]SHE61477.1 Putative SOS response-associated peptidase YedK [[Clostridium] propionicum DSM 1682] [Anaerotignum propionicum DSM 1682]